MTDDTRGKLRQLYPKLTAGEFEQFVYMCDRTGLDPFTRQIYAIDRGGRMVMQVGIDGFRLQAERTGKYLGQDGPYWCGKDGEWRDVWLEGKDKLAAAKVGVYKEGWEKPTYGVATWTSYAQGNQTWTKMPDVMLAKCFSADTEVLTDEGFQPFRSATGRILQVTEHGLETTNARPFSQFYDGPMVTLDSDDLNFCVTPNHDMVTTAGKISAEQLYDEARARPRHWIPRAVAGGKPGIDMPDWAIRLAAAFLADGSSSGQRSFNIAVSRPRKIAMLEEIGHYEAQRTVNCAGAIARNETRNVTTKKDKTLYRWPITMIDPLCTGLKAINHETVLQMSRAQARLFVDTLIDFDGSTQRTGVRRFYSSRFAHIAAVELAAVVGGYSVSPVRERTSDISTRPNAEITISSRSAIPVVRWGRPYQNVDRGTTRKHTGLELQPNIGGVVWCVTVPSGVIVVRRNGFSMLCGNCAEALALRKAFPAELSGLYTAEEIESDPEHGPEPLRIVDVKTGEITFPKPTAETLAKYKRGVGEVIRLELDTAKYDLPEDATEAEVQAMLDVMRADVRAALGPLQ